MVHLVGFLPGGLGMAGSEVKRKVGLLMEGCAVVPWVDRMGC